MNNFEVNWLMNQTACTSQCQIAMVPVINLQRNLIVVLSVALIGLSIITWIKKKGEPKNA